MLRIHLMFARRVLPAASAVMLLGALLALAPHSARAGGPGDRNRDLTLAESTAPTAGRIGDFDWRVNIDLHCFADDTEYLHIPYRVGDTIFGASLEPTFSLFLTPDWSVSAGVFVNTLFGDETALEPVAPIVRLRGQAPDGRFVFIFGSMYTRDLHGLQDVQYVRQLLFKRPTQNGMQLMFDVGGLAGEMAIEWVSLNTPEHREHFDWINRLDVRPVPWLEFSGHAVWAHEGGQLFNNGPVRNNIVVQVTAATKFGFMSEHRDRLRVAVSTLVSFEDASSGDEFDPNVGYGVLVEIGYRWTLRDRMTLELNAMLWVNDFFISVLGNALYQTRDLLPCVTLDWEWQAVNGLQLRIFSEAFYVVEISRWNYAFLFAARFLMSFGPDRPDAGN